MKRTRNFKWIICLFAVTGAICVSISNFSRRERPLLSEARLLRPWNRGAIWSTVAWVNESEILLYTDNAPPASDDNDWDLFLYSIPTRQVNHLKLLNNSVRKTHGAVFSLSCDKHWLLWQEYAEEDTPGSYFVSSLNSNKMTRIPMTDSVKEVAWSGTGHVLVKLVGTDQLSATMRDIERKYSLVQFCNLDNRAATRNVPVSLDHPINSSKFARNGVTFLPNDGLLLHNYYAGSDWQSLAEVETIVASLTDSHVQDYRFTLIPRNGKLYSLVYSGDGKHVAYQIESSSDSTVLAFLHRFIPWIKRPASKSLQLWISNRDGSAMHELGYIDRVPDVNGYPRVTDICWNTDNSQISFQYDNSLWVTAARPQ